MNASSLILKNISICNNLIYRTQFGDEYIKIQVNLNFTLLQCVRVWVACSQTLYFLFNVRRGRVIKFKPEGIYWPPAQGGSGGGGSRALALLADVFEKNEKKNKTTSVYRLQSWPKGFGTLLLPPPLFGRKLVSDRQFTVVNMAMPGFPPPPWIKLKFIHLQDFSKVFGQ